MSLLRPLTLPCKMGVMPSFRLSFSILPFLLSSILLSGFIPSLLKSTVAATWTSSPPLRPPHRPHPRLTRSPRQPLPTSTSPTIVSKGPSLLFSPTASMAALPPEIAAFMVSLCHPCWAWISASPPFAFAYRSLRMKVWSLISCLIIDFHLFFPKNLIFLLLLHY